MYVRIHFEQHNRLGSIRGLVDLTQLIVMHIMTSEGSMTTENVANNAAANATMDCGLPAVELMTPVSRHKSAGCSKHA